jgi:glycosyltransferase involved in cell wall biosynthesis
MASNMGDETTVWLTWHDHTRSHELSRALEVPMHAYSRLPRGALRHVEGTIWTLGKLAKLRPRVLFLQNSFLLLLVCALYKRMPASPLRILIVDCHNKSLRRRLDGILGSVFWRLKLFSFAAVDLVLVSNDSLSSQAAELCSQHVPLIDPPPTPLIDRNRPAPVEVDEYVLFVCSFEPDEPAELIAETAERLVESGPQPIVFTGEAPASGPAARLSHLGHVTFTGFLPWADYWYVMAGAAAVVALTTDEQCLCCAAYEAASCRRPVVLTDHEANRKVFGPSAHYARLSTTSLLAAINEAIESPKRRVEEESVRSAIKSRFDREFAVVESRVATLVRSLGS